MSTLHATGPMAPTVPGAPGRRPPADRPRRAQRLMGLLGLMAVLATPAWSQGAGAEWTTPSGTLQATRYSQLTDITPANAGSLVEELAFPTGVKMTHQGQPLVVGTTMYVVTPFPNKLIAMDLTRPGTTLWTYKPEIDEYARGVACCDVVNRGAVYADGKIIYSLLDNHVIAVDAVKGKLVWRTKLGDPTTGETLTGAPIVVKDKVIVGNAGGELGIRGWVQGLDLKTGRPLWKAYNTGPDADVKIGAGFHPFYERDRGTDLGATTWPGTLWQQGGATSWAWFSYDPGLNLLYYGTGNPGVWNPDMRPGDNKWGASIFARNPDTGEAVWAYQLTPHDGWDYDAVNESIVADLMVGGKMRKVIVHFNKNGFAYTMDRATGEVLVARKFGEVTWADHVDLKTGQPKVNPGMRPHQGEIVSNICPSPLGAKDWEPAAFSPQTGLFYVPAINFCQNFEALKAVYIAGTPFMGADAELFPGPGGYMGELVAWDAGRGEKAWSVKEFLPLYGGVLATAGNVVFYGTLDRWFRAIDATTGAVLFQKQLECPIVGNPMAYTAPDGKQRVAVYTGAGWLAGGLAGGTCPYVPPGESRQGGTALGSAISNLRTVKSPAAPVNAGNAGAQAAGPTSGMVHIFKLP